MATDRRAWATERTWTIKGVSDRTRAAALEAAHEAQLTVGEWIDQVLARAAEEARHPRPPAATPEDVAGVVRELLSEQLAPIAERLAALEAEIGRQAATVSIGERAVAASPVAAEESSERPEAGLERALAPKKARGRRLPEEVRARIEELHRAGRSAYAISKELGVAYTTVHKRVQALEARE
jgi:hypothetical protein